MTNAKVTHQTTVSRYVSIFQLLSSVSVVMDTRQMKTDAAVMVRLLFSNSGNFTVRLEENFWHLALMWN